MNPLFEDLVPALVLMIVAALLGGLIVYLWFRNRYARIEARNNQLAGEASELRRRFGALEDQHKIADQKARNCANELDPLKASVTAKEKSLAQASLRVAALEKEVAELAPFKVEFEDLQARYNAMEDSVREFRANMPAAKPVAAVVAPQDDSKLAEELAREKAVRLSLQGQLDGLRPFRQKYEDLKAKFDALQAGGSVAAPVAAMPVVVEKPAPAPAAPAPRSITEKPKKETEDETLARIQERAQEINFNRIGVATADEKDDLKLVKGIGPFIEKKLNSIGIYTFRQIAAFSEEDEDKVNEVIEFFPGRIRRDNWSKQAGEFEQEKKKNT
ncbi:MAG: hypothetical protein NWR72_05630 [Bacteroidia bacterium]|nr:hypothetical protein [Bacteroidia bacterium]